MSPVHVIIQDARGDTCTKNDFRQDRKVEEGGGARRRRRSGGGREGNSGGGLGVL
jgi:hypothetical protein